MGEQPASKGVLYILSTGTRSLWGGTQQPDGTWKNTPPAALIKIGGVGDVDMDLDPEMADTSNRDNIPFASEATAILKMNGTYKLMNKPTDPGQILLWNAFINQTTVALADLDQASTVSGARGFWMDANVKLKKTGPFKGIYALDLQTSPYDSGVAPQLVQIS